MTSNWEESLWRSIWLPCGNASRVPENHCPGTGLSVGAVHLRIDTVEQAVRNSGLLSQPINDVGYRVAYAVAEDNLRIGRTVVADSVNPIKLTRDAWVAVANAARVPFLEVEVKCLDREEHRRRVRERIIDIPGLNPPTWEDVASREYHEWDREHLVVDTTGQTV